MTEPTGRGEGEQMKRWTTEFLLSILNSRLFNQSPCKYGFIGNVDAFSYENLTSEERQQPGITVKEILEAADRFRSCPIREGGGVTVIEPDGSTHDATIWDEHELRTMLERKPLRGEAK
jgi:hypothetical protein